MYLVLVICLVVPACAYRQSTGTLCQGGESKLMSWSILTKPRWSVTCGDGRAVRFESNSEVEELKALLEDEQHKKKDK